MSLVIYLVLGFIILEGMALLLGPDLVKQMMAEASPGALLIVGLVESLFGAVLLYVFIFFK